ncbi:MAG: DsbA family protein [Acidimicrobiia bacterium]
MIEVFADIVCPFTHVGLRRLVERRATTGRTAPVLHVRAWPLELVNGEPLAGDFVGEEVAALREQVAPDLFCGFDAARFPSTSLPALTLVAAAYRRDEQLGERVSLRLRDALFEEGADIGALDVLAEIATANGLDVPEVGDRDAIMADLDEGRRRNVDGSPHFFLGAEGFFCPSFDITRVDGHLQVAFDAARFEQFARQALNEP